MGGFKGVEMRPRVAVIILNWNGWKDTVECLESLHRIDYPNYHVLVVDNHSEDDSVERIREYCDGKLKVESPFFEYDPKNKPLEVFEIKEEELINETGPYLRSGNDPITLIRSSENRGFAGGNNLGIEHALKNLDPDFVLLLNNDTVVDPSFLSELVDESEDAGIVGSELYFYHDIDRIQSVGVKVEWSRGNVVSLGQGKKEFKRDVKDLDGVSGCSMLIKRDVLDRIGFLNPECFLYYEDTDFCLRARRAGFKVVCAGRSRVWHKFSVSSRKISGTREYYSARNLFLFMRRYADKKQFYTFLLYFFCFSFWFTGGIIVYHREPYALVPFVKGVAEGLKRVYS